MQGARAGLVGLMGGRPTAGGASTSNGSPASTSASAGGGEGSKPKKAGTFVSTGNRLLDKLQRDGKVRRGCWPGPACCTCQGQCALHQASGMPGRGAAGCRGGVMSGCLLCARCLQLPGNPAAPAAGAAAPAAPAAAAEEEKAEEEPQFKAFEGKSYKLK